MTTLKKPITTTLVANTLGSSSRSVKALCTDSNINPWSKWKPIQSAVNTMTESELKTRNYGIQLLKSSNVNTLFNSVKANNLGFTYQKPTDNFRLGDFRDYYHGARIPIETTYRNGEEINLSGSGSDKRTLSGSQTTGTAYEIGANDLYKHVNSSTGLTETLRRGALVTDGTNTHWSTDYINWNNSNFQKFKGKTVTIFEFMTNTRNNDENVYTARTSDVFIALPYPVVTATVSGYTIIPHPNIHISLLAYYDPSDTTVVVYSLSIGAININLQNVTIRNVKVQLSEDPLGNRPIETHDIANNLTFWNSHEIFLRDGSFQSNGKEVYVLVYFNNAIRHIGVPGTNPFPELKPPMI